MTTRRKLDGYVDRQELVRIRQTHDVMVCVARRMVQEQGMNGRLLQLVSRLAVALAEQGQAIAIMEQIRSEQL